jgi:hypothetical protein
MVPPIRSILMNEVTRCSDPVSINSDFLVISLSASSSIMRVMMCLPLPCRECTNSHSSKNHQLKALRQSDPKSNRGRQIKDLVVSPLRVDVELPVLPCSPWLPVNVSPYSYRSRPTLGDIESSSCAPQWKVLYHLLGLGYVLAFEDEIWNLLLVTLLGSHLCPSGLSKPCGCHQYVGYQTRHTTRELHRPYPRIQQLFPLEVLTNTNVVCEGSLFSNVEAKRTFVYAWYLLFL